jgi:hypothetical protein
MPFTPFKLIDFKDAFIRFPKWSLVERSTDAKALQEIKASPKKSEDEKN